MQPSCTRDYEPDRIMIARWQPEFKGRQPLANMA